MDMLLDVGVFGLQRPGSAAGPVQPLVRIVVTHNDLLDGVPFQRAFEPVADVAKVADGACAVRYFDIPER
jgi:hypothetical protein